MYPKQHPTDPAALRNSMDFKKQQKRDQLTQLLVNKFRNKYLISLQNERSLDEKIQSAVIDMVAKDANMTERSLHVLDRQLVTLVNAARGTSNATASGVDMESTKEKIDAMSCKSKMSRTASHAAQSSGAIRSEGGISQTLNAITQGKGLGMTEGEWNQIVLQNVQKENADQQRKKDTIQRQRDEMKIELARQVEQKREIAAAQKRQEMNAFSNDIGLNNVKQDAEAARRVAAKDKYFNKMAFLNEQVTKAEESKRKDAQDMRISDIQERNRIDQFVKNKQDEERNAANQKRLQLKKLTEEDRILKLAMAGDKSKDMGGADLMSKVFDTKDHQSYALRARNDRMQSHIQGKFDFKNERKTALLDGSYAQEGVNKAEQARQMKDIQRKATEIEVKAALDDQVRRAKEVRDMERDEVKKIGQRVQTDVTTYEQEIVIKKNERRDINKNHQKEVTRQIDERKKLLKHIGSQIMAKE